jgi:hypothetical protein
MQVVAVDHSVTDESAWIKGDPPMVSTFAGHFLILHTMIHRLVNVTMCSYVLVKTAPNSGFEASLEVVWRR